MHHGAAVWHGAPVFGVRSKRNFRPQVRLYEGTYSDNDRRGVTVNDIAGPVKWLGQ